MTPNNKTKQALVIEGSTVLTNHHGMAPGMMRIQTKQLFYYQVHRKKCNQW